MVEANSLLCKQLKKHRKRDEVINVAISDRHSDKKLNFYICSLPTRSTLSKESMEEFRSLGFQLENTVPIDVRTFDELVEAAGFCPDYISIDVEGMDEAVLNSIDFARYPVKVVVTEAVDTALDKRMLEFGFDILDKRYGGNTIYGKSHASIPSIDIM